MVFVGGARHTTPRAFRDDRTTGMTAQSVPAPASRRRGLQDLVRLESLAVLIVLIVGLSILSPYFLSVSNFLNILLATAVVGVLAFGATFIIGSAGIDLSVGSVLALSGVIMGISLKSFGVPWPLAVLICVATGTFCGLINGWLIAYAGIPAFIVTLGMLGVARGVALVLTNGGPKYGLDEAIVYMGQGRPFGIPFPVFIFLLLAVVTHFVLVHMRFGSHTLVIGDNEGAARAMGINVERHRLALYALSGAFAGIAGLVFAARTNSADPASGVSYELTAITATILGGTNLFGGRATIIGTLVGALIVGVLQNGLTLLAVPPFYQQIMIGVVLVLAVWLDLINRARAMR
jgi:ribose transport system permease protein